MHPFIRRIIVLGTPLAVGILNLFHPSSQAIRPNLAWWITLHILNLPLFALLGLAAILLLDGKLGALATCSRALLAIFAVLYPAFDAMVGIGSGMMIRFATTLPASQQGPIVLATREFFRFGTPAITIALVGSMAWLLGLLAAAVALARPVWSRWLVISLAGVVFLLWLLEEAEIFLSLGTAIWIGITFVVLVLICVALAVVARPHPAVGLLAASGFFFAIDHAAPFGPAGMALFLLAVGQLEILRQRQAAGVPTLAGAPRRADESTP